MALIFNNLLINKNSKRYKPFLINLISGRRRRLNDEEFKLVYAMLCKEDFLKFNDAERILHDKLTGEKQFIDDVHAV